jgi:hypothetical protein
VTADSRGLRFAVVSVCLFLSACAGTLLPDAHRGFDARPLHAGFASPTGHIVCLMGSGSVRCEFHGTKTWSAPWPDGCELDCDSALEVNDQVVGVCAGDTIIEFAQPGQSTTAWWHSGGPTVTISDMQMMLAVLPYGSALAVGHMRCDSETTGVTCRNLTTGHGFSMAREAYSIF